MRPARTVPRAAGRRRERRTGRAACGARPAAAGVCDRQGRLARGRARALARCQNDPRRHAHGTGGPAAAANRRDHGHVADPAAGRAVSGGLPRRLRRRGRRPAGGRQRRPRRTPAPARRPRSRPRGPPRAARLPAHRRGPPRHHLHRDGREEQRDAAAGDAAGRVHRLRRAARRADLRACRRTPERDRDRPPPPCLQPQELRGR